jgi:sterol desaturase/sphingolipid hydroxylase (fatty acid hydroxylase superfamily)
MFNHRNARLDRFLRWFVMTPDMHRVHHSIVVGETNSSFGFKPAVVGPATGQLP